MALTDTSDVATPAAGLRPRLHPENAVEGTGSKEAPLKKRITTSHAPAPIGPYSQGIVAGGFLFVSGQTPLTESGEVPDDAGEQATVVIEKVRDLLGGAGASQRRRRGDGRD